jgi:hypothetical protein
VRCGGAFTSSTIVAGVLAIAPVAVTGQTTVPARTADGKPNLQGIWQVVNTAAWDLQDHSARLGIPAGQGVVEGNEGIHAWCAADHVPGISISDLQNILDAGYKQYYYGETWRGR